MLKNILNINGEIIGVFAIFFIVLSFLEKDDNKMFILLAIGSFFYGLHFYILGLFSGALINIFDVIKNLAVTEYKNNKYIFIFFFLSYMIIGIKTNNGDSLSHFYTIASSISLFGAFFLKGLQLRIVYLIATLMHLFYTIVGKSISGSITNFLFIISICISIFLIYRRKTLRGKIRYYYYLLEKKTRKIFGLKHRRMKFFG